MLPNARVRLHHENVSDERDQTVLGRGSYLTAVEWHAVNWVIIGLNNDLSPVKSHIIILIDAHVFPFVHIGKRYNWFVINMQRLASK